jgi:hypothetical protein
MDTARALVAFSLIPIAMWVHAELATRFGWYQKWPVAELVVMAASVIVLLRMWLRIRPASIPLIALNVMAWLLVGFFLWWTQIYSSYAKMDTTVAIGGVAKEGLSIDGLVDESGAAVDLEKLLQRSEATLLVFYRGHW